MKIPKTVNILGLKVKVVYKKELQQENKCGQACVYENRIELNPYLERELLEKTFIHECLHFVTHRAGLNISGFYPPELEEVINELISNFVYEELIK